jgi:flagellar biosynthesis GTPase FlhF
MLVEVTEVSNSNSEASSASAHFKRKKPRKQIPLGHRPVTRRRTNSGSDEPKDDESHSQNCNSGPTHEEVLMANSGGSAEQQVAQLEAALRQKEEELAALRRQVADKAANGENERPEGSRTNNQNDPPLSVEAIQRMISEGVKAQYMQTHYSMRPGYVKPYPPEVDMVPFPDNYRQPQFTKFNGTGSPHEHVAHFLAACQNTSHNGALLLR